MKQPCLGIHPLHLGTIIVMNILQNSFNARFSQPLKDRRPPVHPKAERAASEISRR